MSMSKKVFGVVVLLIAVAVIITAVSVVGIERINSSTEQLGRLAARSVNLTVIDRIVQQRGAATLRLIINTDPAIIERNMNERFLPTEKAMEEELANYTTNFPEDATQEMKQRPAEIKKRWDAYAAATAKVAELAKINSNSQATALVSGRKELWRKMDQDLAELLAAARNTEGVIREWGSRLADSRVELAYYQVAIAAAISTESDKEFQDYNREARRRMEAIHSAVKAGEGLPVNFGAKAREISAHIAEKELPALNEIMKLAAMNSNLKAMEMFRNEADPVFTVLDDYTTKLEVDAISGQGQALATANALGARVNLIAIVVSVAGILLAGVLAYFIVSRIVRQLNRIITGLSEASTQVALASVEISSSSESLAEGATEQAASLEESSAAMEEMASMTHQNADNSTRTAETTGQTVKLIGEGAKSVQSMSQAMAEISDSADKIGSIIKTIEEIAFQTNLLALNAAVEAARAGEAGLGFAVVADEVRNLAQRSAQAAGDTADLIKGTVTRVQHGAEIATALDANFKKIDAAAQGVGQLVEQISVATTEQAQGVGQVNQAVAQMDKVTQSNAAAAEECAAASEELSAQAKALKDMVGDLLALVSGGRAERGASPAGQAMTENYSPERRASMNGKQRQLPGPARQKPLMKPNDDMWPDDKAFRM